jgi:hypothetical protein
VTEQLGRRCALVMLAALMLAAAVGLLAWGPITVGAEHDYADRRIWLGVPNAFDVLACLPLFAAGLWGWHATRRSTWPHELRRPLGLFHLCAVASAALAAIHHAGGGATGYLLSQVAMSAACVMLSAGLLAERVDARFGTPRGMKAATVSIIVMVMLVLLGIAVTDTVDLRPLLFVQSLPVLLAAAGAPSLPGRHTRSRDWLLLLATYAVSRLFELGDAAVFRATGWVGGHALMHLGLAGVAGWLAYCGARAPADAAGDVSSRRRTSLNTAS